MVTKLKYTPLAIKRRKIKIERREKCLANLRAVKR